MGNNETNQERLVTDVNHCARCGENHLQLTFIKFTGRPVFDERGDYDYWALCPVTRDPLLLSKSIMDEYTNGDKS